jgi:hypothetical protein
MHFDVNDLWATVYGRATTHADGAPLRAALAQGAAQLIDAVSFDLLRPVDPEDRWFSSRCIPTGNDRTDPTKREYRYMPLVPL